MAGVVRERSFQAGVAGEPFAEEGQHLGELGGVGGIKGHAGHERGSSVKVVWPGGPVCGSGRLIHEAYGSRGGCGGLRTNRSGWAA